MFSTYLIKLLESNKQVYKFAYKNRVTTLELSEYSMEISYVFLTLPAHAATVL